MSDLIYRQAAIDVAKGPVVMQGIRSGKSVTAAAVDAVKCIIADGLRDLPSAQPESCEDAVSRKTVKELMLKYGFIAPDMTVTEFVEDCLPPVTPKQAEPKEGEWELGNFDVVRGYWTRCLICGRTSFGGGSFCRECGAKMKLHKGKE